MWETASALINKLPEGYLMVLLTLAIGLCAYIAPRLRRDKQGRWYVYSRQYEAAKQARKAGNAELQKKY